MIAGLGVEGPDGERDDASEAAEVGEGFGPLGAEGAEGAEGADGEGAGTCGAHNGTWWWGCNACWCGAGAPACTRLWCGLPDCRAPGAQPCRTDEVHKLIPLSSF